MTGRKSGSISRTAPPALALATRLETAAAASATWCSTARAFTTSKSPARPAPRGCRPGKLEPGHVRLDQGHIESTATARPPGATRPASQADIEPLPQPTSSARAPAQAQLLKVAAVHRIEQPRHQRQPLALAFLAVIEDVL